MHFTDSIAQRRQTAKQRDFLAHFARSGNILASAKLAGVSRQLVYYWRDNSPTFAERLSLAADDAFGDKPPALPQSAGKPSLAVRKRERSAS